MSTIKVNSIEPANAGSEDYFLARAWVNFNGSGTITILDSGNVSSLTDYGTGHYSNNFASALPSSSFVATGTPSGQWHQVYRYYLDPAKSTAQYRLRVLNAAGSTYYDSTDIMMVYHA